MKSQKVAAEPNGGATDGNASGAPTLDLREFLPDLLWIAALFDQWSAWDARTSLWT